MTAKIEELYEQGMESFNKRDYETAERMFREILSQNPKFADIQNKMGIIYNQTNRLPLAAKAFETALELNPGYTEASLNLAITYSDMGQYEKSREVFERASRFTTTASREADPFVKGKIANEHLKLGNIYLDLRMHDSAIDEYRKALKLSPNFADIITQLGIAYRDKGMHDEAIKAFTRAKEANPHFIAAWLHLGVTYYSQGFYSLAEQEWRDGLKIDPNNTGLKTYLNFVKPQGS
jgi:tetratricopeptide (TPR) repeat protein